MLSYFQFFLLCLLASRLSGQSLFESENVDGDRKIVVGVNLPPKFLPGGDMDGFSLPEDTSVGTIVSSKTYKHQTGLGRNKLNNISLSTGLSIKR